jgi:integral membrane sensor domain MASE1
MTRHRVLSYLAYVVAYSALALVSMRQLDATTLSTLFWPPVGLLMAALLLNPARRWPIWMVLAAVPHTAIGMLVAHRTPGIALIFAAADLAFCGAVAALLRLRHANAAHLFTLPGALWFIGLLSVCAAVAGALVAQALRLIQPTTSPDHWYIWSMAAFVSCMIMTPLIVAWANFRFRRLADQNLLHLWVGLIAAFALLIGTTIVFDDPPRATALVWHDGFGMSYGPLLFLSVVALCWGAPGGSLTVAGLAVVAGSYTLSGMGPYANIGHFAGEPLLAVQGYVGCAAVLNLIINALSADRERALHRNGTLKAQLQAALRVSGQVAWEFWPMAGGRLQWLGQLPLGLAGGRDELTLDEWLERAHPEDRDKVRAWLQGMDAPYSRPLRFRLRGTDDHYHVVEMTGSRTSTESGAPDRMMGLLGVSRGDILF